MAELLEVKNLSVSFFTPAGEVQAVRNVSFSLRPGEVLAVVGESGCGKSVLCKSIMKLLPRTARIQSGSILVNGADVSTMPVKFAPEVTKKYNAANCQALNITVPGDYEAIG